MPLMGCFFVIGLFHGLQQLVLEHPQAVSYLTPNWRFSPSLTSLFWLVTTGALPETTWSGELGVCENRVSSQ